VFDFSIGSVFFEQAEDFEIRSGNVAVNVEMVKDERMMDFHFRMSGVVEVLCDRCNEPVNLTVEGTERLIVKLGERYEEESDEVQIIPESAHHFDLAPFIYDYIHLLLPSRRIHPQDAEGSDTCDPVILQKLEELTPGNQVDPRWEVLKKLKEK
jgi:uncharacterized metal-binding protein YceD (DUF177 family)